MIALPPSSLVRLAAVNDLAQARLIGHALQPLDVGKQ
jgi:hypothetical protein